MDKKTILNEYFSKWPEEARPESVGIKAAQLFASQEPGKDKHYKEACAWYGALRLAKRVDDNSLLSKLVAKYQPFVNTFDELLSGNGHVDNNVFGIVPLEISRNVINNEYKKDGLALAKHQYRNISHQIRYAIDDMFMITSLQLQAFRVSGDIKFRGLAAKTMVAYLNELQQDDGLFFHHKDFQHRWCRGNGWVAAGMAELIQELPEESLYFQAVFDGYSAMMNSLLKFQIKEGPGKGLWKQILNSTDERNWPETSGSAMFCYSMVTGIMKGWLNIETYGSAARDAWLALTAMLTEEGQLKDVSKWAYKPESHPESRDKYLHDEENYYFEREKLIGDNHGQAPFMWSAAALIM